MELRRLPFALSRQGEITLLSLLTVCVAAGAGSRSRPDVGIRLGVVALVGMVVVVTATRSTHCDRPCQAS